MTDQKITWWATTWGKLHHADLVRAPDGSAWTVLSAMTFGDKGEWRITRDGVTAWTSHQLDEEVSAVRPSIGLDVPAEVILGRLRMAFGNDVELLQAGDTGSPDAPRYIRCGQRKCTRCW